MSILEKQANLYFIVFHALKRFPKHFDERFAKGFCALIGNTSSQFADQRSNFHLQRIIVTQFSLQKKIENILSSKELCGREAHIRIFLQASRICLALVLSYESRLDFFHDHLLLYSIQSVVPGIKQVPHSFYSWASVDYPYLFCYAEFQKIGGKDLNQIELKEIQKSLKKIIICTVPSHNQSLFWPYNHEEIHRNVISLKNELHSKYDLPQVSIQFKGQHSSYLEFLVHLVCPKNSISLDQFSQRLSNHFELLLHSEFNSSFSSEAFVFSVKLPILELSESINLLKARNSVVALLEEIIGPFRDFNGALLTEQEVAFDRLKKEFESQIDEFSLFAEKLFYSLRPIEAQIALSVTQAEILFRTFSLVLRTQKSFYFSCHPDGVLVIKTKHLDFLLNEKNKATSALLTLQGMHYLVYIDPLNIHTQRLVQLISNKNNCSSKKTLRLMFQEGLPPSLNTSYLAPELRCRTIYKALFEGLTRLNHNGEPALAGAESYSCSEDKLRYVFSLRPNRWSNGEKVTAYHYEFGWKQIFTHGDLVDTRHFFVIKNGRKAIFDKSSPSLLGVYARDNKTLEVHLEYPDPFFLHRLSHPLFSPAYDQRKEPLLHNGPFLVYSQNTDSLILERNPYYWDCNNIYFERFEINNITENSNIFDLYTLGQVDWIGDPFVYLSFEQKRQMKEKVYIKDIKRQFYLFFNTEDPFLCSSNTRKALALGINYKKFREVFRSSPEITLFPRKSDLSLAKGLIAPNQPIALNLNNYDGIGEEFVKFLVQSWEENLGIQVNIKNLKWNTHYQALQKGEFQMGGCFIAGYSNDDFEMLERMDQSCPLNFSRFRDLEYSSLITQARKTSHAEKRKTILQKARSIINEKVPFISLLNRNHFYSHRNSLKGYVVDPAGGVDLSYCYEKS